MIDNMNDEDLDDAFEGLTELELKDTVVRNVKAVNRLKEDAKIYSKSARSAVKELERRSEKALEIMEKLRSMNG